MHQMLGQYALALAAFQEVDGILIAEEQKGNKTNNLEVLVEMGYVYLQISQLEAAKRCFLRTLARPRIEANDKMNAYQGLARCHRERQDWVQTIKCAEDALAWLPAARKILPLGSTEERLLYLLADAAEGQENLERAREYDEQVRKRIARGDARITPDETVGAARRHALELLAAGKPHEAEPILIYTPNIYKMMLRYAGINLLELQQLRPVMAALKVLATAMLQTGKGEFISETGKIQADVEETEAILTGYWEGVLGETRRELVEQRQAAAAEAAVVAEGDAATALKKSKAAKRKQQKRKAQQLIRMEATAAAAAATATNHGGEVTQGQDEDSEQAQQEQVQEGERNERGKFEEEEEDGDGAEPAATAATEALAAMALGAKKGEEERQAEVEGEEEEDECSVYLTMIDSGDAGPPLLCGHRYHAFCLHFWVEKCTSKCIEPTCPYCRAPVQEM